ncbi:MAG: murein biosynthesis integral membrane protein MurJ [Candidatus Limnocylindrales bacterium]
MTAATRTLARAGLIVSVAILASRVLGWLRTVVISAIFGAGPQLDAYFAAFRIPDLIFQLVAAGALSTALIPVLAGLFARGEDDHAWRVVASVGNAMMVALLLLAVVVELAAPVLVPLITPGFDQAQLELTVTMTRVMILSPLFLAAGAIAGSALNASGRFAAAAAAPLLYNVAIMAAALFLAPALGVEALAVGVVVGAILSLLVQLPQLMGLPRFAYRLAVDLRDPAAREALFLMVPRAIGLGVTQFTFLVNTALATTLGAGALTAYNVAFTILQIPIGLVGLPLGIVLLPSLSRAAALDQVHDFGRLLSRALRQLRYVLLFLTTVLMVLRVQVVTVLFDYGRFDAQAIAQTADALLLFLVGLAAHGLIQILARAFYARKDTRTPVIAAILSVIVNVVVSIATVGTRGLAGLALGIAAGAWFEAVLLLVLLVRGSIAVEAAPLARSGLLAFGGALLAGAVAWLVAAGFAKVLPDPASKLGSLAQLIVAGGAAGLAYVAYSWVLRLPELGGTWAVLRVALRRTEDPA